MMDFSGTKKAKKIVKKIKIHSSIDSHGARMSLQKKNDMSFKK